MTTSAHALGLLAALASVSFASMVRPTRWRATGVAVSFLASMVVLGGTSAVDPAALGLVVAGAACLALFGRLPGWAAVVAAGLLAGVWGAYLESRGLPPVAAWILAASAPGTAMALARQGREFRPTHLGEEGHVLVAALGVLVAGVPRLTSGWESAAALNFESDIGAEAAASGAGWVWWVLVGALGSGGLVALVRSRLGGRRQTRGGML